MEKKELRAQIKAIKKQHTKEQLQEQSEKILAKLERHPSFLHAERVMLYSALPDEVQTQDFLERWHLRKTIILPTVVGDDIIPVEYGKDTAFAVGDFNILEPQNEPYTGGFDLIVVPGVAFDRHGNRIGRGKGYYDRFLCHYPDVERIGICFDFQLVDEVPTEPLDIRMDEVISGAEPIEQLVFRRMREQGLTFASAESCTGGNIAHRITLIPGSSEVFRGAAVTYATPTKTKVLGVPADIIEQYTVVSRPVVEAMAQGVRNLMESDFGVATTGVAGPGGGTEETPVGTVWIGVASKDGVVSQCFNFGKDRETVINRATAMAYEMLRKNILFFPGNV